MSIQQVQDRLGLSKRSVFRLLKRGDIRKVRFGGAMRIIRESLDGYERKQIELQKEDEENIY
jgi:excisionase family DNA binding protein